jgi:hypothetical protein
MQSEESMGAAADQAATNAKRGRKRSKAANSRAPQDPARRRVLFLCEQAGEAGPVRIIRTFPNRYRMRKWIAVAVDIDPTLRDRLKVIHGRHMNLSELLGAE